MTPSEIEEIKVENELEAMVGPECPNCRHSSPGKFCPACGEQILKGADYSLRGLLGETLNVVTNLESNIFRSFAALLTGPGFLTAEYFAGRRKRYLKPVQLFIFCNIIFFFFQAFTGFNTLRTPLRVHLHNLPYSALARRRVGKALAETHVPFAEYQARFDTTIETQAKTLVFLMIPMFALGLLVLHVRRKEYFVKHLVFAIHFFSFYLLFLSLLYLIAIPIMTFVSRLRGSEREDPSDLFLTAIMLSACYAYLFIAQRRAYAQGWVLTALKSFALIVVLMIVVQSFRLILFFTTFYSI